MPFSPAIFEVDANPGALISILNGPDVTLTGSNGGTLRLHIGTSSTGTPFIATAVPPNRTEVRIAEFSARECAGKPSVRVQRLFCSNVYPGIEAIVITGTTKPISKFQHS